jgi:hypothetical protein
VNAAIQSVPAQSKPFKHYREYGKVSAGLWTGERVPAFAGLSGTGKLVALYLVSSPHANMLGLYRLPLAYLAADTGLTRAESEDALKELTEAELVSYSVEQQFVWVRYFIPTQVLTDATGLNANDKQSIHAQRVFDSLAGVPFRNDLLEAYGPSLNLHTIQ